MLIKAAITMFAYAGAMLFVGWLTTHVAPPGANALTALIVSAAIAVLMIACGVATLMLHRNRRIGMIGIHVALLVPLLGVVGPGMRLGASLAKTDEYNAKLKDAGEVTVTLGEEALRNTAYQAVGLGSSAALSTFAFVALLAHRPKPPKPEPKSTPSGD